MESDRSGRTGDGSRKPIYWLAAARERLSGYGMLGVLILLCFLYSLLTLQPQQVEGEAAARDLARQLVAAVAPGDRILPVARPGEAGDAFLAELERNLEEAGRPVAGVASGDPAAVRAALESLPVTAAGRLWIPTPQSSEPVVRAVLANLPELSARVLTPRTRRWPTFLLKDNLRNVANQIAVIAILAVGMTLVIITGGIDLSVGSLIALAAVLVAGLIGGMGGAGASVGAVIVAGAGAILLCAGCGAFTGLMITRFKVPPFIATLGMMQVASGLAYLLSRGTPIYLVPAGFTALGRGADPLLGVPWAVILMLALYLAAHLLMSRTVLGRHIYAVGGNDEAARLAGVRVRRVRLFVYVVSAGLAGLGGVVMASQLNSGAPTYGLMYELYVIAAVVVGGTSLSGGRGRVFGTLIGAFIIAVIQNGMNLTNVESYTQKVVLGLVILGAVLLDRLKRR